MAHSNMYFAALPKEDIGQELMRKVSDWYTHINSSGIFGRMKKSYYSYYGYSESSGSTTADIIRGGQQGELALVKVNHYRNLVQHILVMTTNNRPAMEARAVNTDHRSLAQTLLANGILDYYMREKRLEEYLKMSTEYSLIFGEGYITLEWDTSLGDEFGVDPETERIIHSGDLRFNALHPLDVIKDLNEPEGDEPSWRIVRRFRNKYDLAAKYPDLADDILGLPDQSKDGSFQFVFYNAKGFDKSDLVPVYEFYHKKSEALPEGRLVAFLSDDIILYDGPLPYRDVPIYRISPGNFIGTVHGYSPGFDLLAIQDAVDALYSTVITNQTTFGVQNILIPSGHNISVSEIAGGMNIIEYDSQVGKPEALNLTNTPVEIFNFIEKLERTMETISGVNQVARGDPAANLRSGNALALIQSMAIQFNSGLQQSYARLIENVGTGIINTLKYFAEAPRIIMITGKNNMSYMKEFRGSDLDKVNRVIVDVANPLSKTMAGKVEIADNLLQMGQVSAEQYINLIKTGNLDVMLEGKQSELMLIKQENEFLTDGRAVVAIVTDNHMLHIQEHKAVLASPDIRQNPEIVKVALDHIQEHIELLRNTDPGLLMVLGQQPIPPVGQPMQGSPEQMGLPPGAEAPLMGEGNSIPELAEAQMQPGEELPSQPSPATNPLSGQPWNPESGGL